MYTVGDLVVDFTSGDLYMREILSPEGEVICYVPEYNNAIRPTMAEILLSHLNRG